MVSVSWMQITDEKKKSIIINTFFLKILCFRIHVESRIDMILWFHLLSFDSYFEAVALISNSTRHMHCYRMRCRVVRIWKSLLLTLPFPVPCIFDLLSFQQCAIFSQSAVCLRPIRERMVQTDLMILTVAMKRFRYERPLFNGIKIGCPW